MCSPAAGSKIHYRNSRLLRTAFLQLHRQQRADVFCDVVLQAEGEAVPAHCCILSACSPFFMERLACQVPSQGCRVVLELRGLKIGILRKLVDFLYTSEMEVSREEAQEVLAAARQFQVAELELLQLQGGKLVKEVLGRRLNRECLQPPSAALISARIVPQVCQPTPPTLRTFRPLVAGKQHMSKPLADGEVHASTASSQVESNKQGTAVVPQNRTPQLGTQSAMVPMPPVETGNVKTKRRSLCPATSLSVGSTVGKADGSQGERSAEPSESCSANGSPLPRKIKLSRPKLPPPSNICPEKAVRAAAPSKTPTAIRRVWRQKTPGCGEAGELEKARSPPMTPKPSTRKRSSSVPASGSDAAPEEGPVGRVKLRKVINGSCWEVVQEPPAREPPSVPVTAGETVASHVASPPVSALPNLLCWPELPGTHAAGYAEPQVTKPEAAPVLKQVTVPQGPLDGRGGCRDPYDLDVAALEPLSENEEFGAPAPLEQMLDLMLSGNDVEGLGVGGPGGTAGLSRGPNTPPLDAAAAAGEEWRSPEAQVWQEWDDAGKGPLSGWEAGAEECAFSIAEGDACGQLPPRTLPDTQNPQHPSVEDMEDDTGKEWEPHTTQAPGMETETQPQVPGSLPRSCLKHSPLDSVESDDEIDIMAGAEEALVPAGFTCVRPDSSSESDTEVDVLN